MKSNNQNSKINKDIIELDLYEINEEILYLLNEARSSPKNFCKYLNINDNKEKEIQNLFHFFNNRSLRVQPLIFDKNLSICSKDLLEHILSKDIDNEEINQFNLNKRMERLNLIPINYNNFIILDAEDPLDALINLFLNIDYRNTILSSDMNYIGIAAGFFQDENLCIIIDIVQKFKNINKFRRIRNKSIDQIYNFNDDIKKTYNLSTNYTDKKNINNKMIFSKEINNKMKNRYINEENFFDDHDYLTYKFPISVNITKEYVKDKYGNLHLIYNRESNYDDGSILIQPDIY